MSTSRRGLGPAAEYRHDHPPVRSVNEEIARNQTLGQCVADWVALVVGSWPFIIAQSLLLFLWMGMNVYLVVMEHSHPGFLRAWDPYPFILLNLVLSFQAAYTGPVVMMSQNRQAEKDRMTAQNDFEVDTKAEEEIKVIMKHLVHQDEMVLEALARIEELRNGQQGPAGARTAELLQRLEQHELIMREMLARMDPPKA